MHFGAEHLPQDVRIGARQGRPDYQFTLWRADLAQLQSIAPRLTDQLVGCRESSMSTPTRRLAACKRTKTSWQLSKTCSRNVKSPSSSPSATNSEWSVR